MRNVLVIVNYMRVNPTIIDDLVLKMKDDFEKIYVVNRHTNSSYHKIKNLEKVHIKEIALYKIYLKTFKSIFSFGRKEVLEDMKFSIKEKKFGYKYLKTLFKFLHISNILHDEISTIKEIKDVPQQVSMLSLWYTSEAYAISKIKIQNPDIKIVSMAHAHEIEPTVNPYVFMLKKFMHSNLETICFIADSKKETYIETVCKKMDLSINSLRLMYWGSERLHPEKNNETIEILEKKVIVSCSTVQDIKRVDLIADAFLLYNNDSVEWYHFGDGAEYENLKNKIASFPEKIKNRIHLEGRVENENVKEFYFNNKPDLFINVSVSEGLPISVMEALSYGIPVIATDVGGEKEIIKNNINGFLIPSNLDAPFLAEKIEEFFYMDNNQRKEFSGNSKEIWDTRFNLNKNIKSYIEILK